jgi:GLPGLI family protein
MHTRAIFKLTSIIGFFIVFAYGCGSKSGGNGISEGVIEYDAEPVDKAHPMADLAPTKMTVKFKENKSCVDLSAGMGLFSTSFISDPDSRTMIQLVKLLNKKYAHVFDTIELRKENEKTPKMVVQKTNETKMIAKYKCKKAHISFPGTDNPGFDVFYTTDIDIQNPNWSNPFSEIEGVMMEYQMTRHGMEMHFIARAVNCIEVDDAVFEVPEDYKVIGKPELDDLFEAFQ